ncbi:MAG: DNA-binding protein WhiA [Firmicutes bacterium]|nr:DNA-binding protein WhiA [Bacillota bacterium]
MTFASKVKNEICKQEIESICCARAQLAGIVCFAAHIRVNSLIIKTESKAVLNQAVSLIKHLYHLSAETTKSAGGIYSISLFGAEATKVLRDMKLSSVPIRIDSSIVRRECCKRAFVQGAFLGGGSISDPLKGYHAEFVTSRFGISDGFSKLLCSFGIMVKVVNRKGNYVFYIKESGQIEDLLAVLSAHACMMGFVNIKIEKELRNTTNRLVNCENANSEKRAEASVAQKHAILALDKKIGLDNLPPQLAQLAKMRLENPEAALSDFAAELGITKSGVNHRMRRIIQMANERK